MASNTNMYTLITGASAGIGKAVAFECARRKMNLLLIALDEPALYEVTRQIQEEFSVSAHCLGIDLCRQESPQQVFEWCQANHYQVDILINNAGFGRGGIFEDIALEEYYSMMQLNNLAMIGLIHFFLPHLKKLPRAHILNMSSMEAALPLPYKTVYTGTKNFVYAVSLALREELKFSRVKVSVLCPGPVLTNEDGLKRLKAQGGRAKLLLQMPDNVARIAIPRMLRGQRVIVPGALPKLLVSIAKVFPLGLKMAILEKVFRVYKDSGGIEQEKKEEVEKKLGVVG
jgi:uncharacterized protein